jgi:hypothetical protein
MHAQDRIGDLDRSISYFDQLFKMQSNRWH